MRWMTAGLMNALGAMDVITAPRELRRGMSEMGLRRRISAAVPASAISAAGSVMLDGSSPLAAATMLWAVPPEIMSEGRGRPGGPLIDTCRSASTRSSLQRSRAASAASRTERSGGSASNPHTCTSLTPASVARASKSSMIRRTNGISPVRST